LTPTAPPPVTPTLVSVIIPVRDCERYLAEAVGSVLDQSFEDVDLIVVDDGSEDATPDVLSALGPSVRSVRQEPAGTAAALNRGVELARGAFLAFLDADDLWTPRKLERQMALLASNPELDLALGHVRQFHSPELSEQQRAAIACPPGSAPGLTKGTMLVRRESFSRVGAFDTTWRLGEFIDWYARATEYGLASEMLPDVLMLRRLHGRNTTLREPEARVDYTRVVRAALSRRRPST
jgi:glycosyltransferase involved in cell wall biosynthesis